MLAVNYIVVLPEVSKLILFGVPTHKQYLDPPELDTVFRHCILQSLMEYMAVLAVGGIVSGPCSVILYHICTSRLCSPANLISAVQRLGHFQSTHLESASGGKASNCVWTVGSVLAGSLESLTFHVVTLTTILMTLSLVFSLLSMGKGP